ncbi:thioesterase II family protein [Streptomyces sp. NPDC017638]|uniref:thioesterase II family protein n=1 Tax=Streptomyces sp. NPDC017638 TaxID=3365004 RepID=UPI0037B8B302
MSTFAGPARPSAADRWIRRTGPEPATVRLRLFCFHYAGGSPTMFRTWPPLMPQGVSVEPVLLPGRDARFREAPFDRMAPLAEAVAEALAPRLDRPYALFGYSMGAQVAFHVAHALRAAGLPQAEALFVGASPGPFLQREVPAWDKSDAHLVAYLRDMGGTPRHVLDDPELLALMLPTLRADLTTVATCPYTPRPALGMPVHAFAGQDDPSASPERMRAWERESDGAFRLTVLPGGHFFLNDHLPAVAGAVHERLREVGAL